MSWKFANEESQKLYNLLNNPDFLRGDMPWPQFSETKEEFDRKQQQKGKENVSEERIEEMFEVWEKIDPSDDEQWNRFVTKYWRELEAYENGEW